MAVELDDSLGGAPTQHRELQGAESDLFLSYFPNGIRLKAGGVKSGFTTYDPEDVERRLFKVKGDRNVHVSEVGLIRRCEYVFICILLLGACCCQLSEQV